MGPRREDAEPCIGIVALPGGQRSTRDRGPANAVEAVTASDGVADELVVGAVCGRVAQHRMIGIQRGHLGAGYLELQRAAIGETPGDQVLDHLGLRIDSDGAAAGQIAEIDVLTLSGELQVDAAMFDPLTIEPVCEAGLAQQGDTAVLEYARALSRFAILTAADFDDHRLDAAKCEQVRKQQASWARPDDAYLGTHVQLGPAFA